MGEQGANGMRGGGERSTDARRRAKESDGCELGEGGVQVNEFAVVAAAAGDIYL